LGRLASNGRAGGDIKVKLAAVVLMGYLMENIESAAHSPSLTFISLTSTLLTSRSECTQGKDDKTREGYRVLACQCLYCLRLLFSVPKNTRYFKMVFPTFMYARFVDITSINKERDVLDKLFDELLTLKGAEIEMMKDALENLEFSIIEAEAGDNALKMVAGYRLVEVVGQGAYGKVYSAIKDGVKYAVKEIPLDTQDMDRITAEVNILRGISHPNVANYVDAFKKGQSAYIVMEFVEGLTLLEYMKALQEREAKVPEDKLMRICLELLMVLRYLHGTCKIVHRDLNPSNVMVTFGLDVKVTDFGLSQSKDHGPSKDKTFEGTLAYSAPEVVEHTSYNDKADVWSLGCILYELVSFKQAFHSTNPLTLAKNITSCEYPPLPANCPEKLKQIITLCLTKDHNHRPSVTALLTLLLEEVLDHYTLLKGEYKH
jgi:hypothetical protein